MLQRKGLQLALLTIMAAATSAAQTPSLTFTTYSVGAKAGVLTPGPDGAIWFLEAGASKIGRITTAGGITEYDTPHPPAGLTAGPDGALWFTEDTVGMVGRMTTAGAITEYNVPCTTGFFSQNCGQPEAITAGPDGALWFTECCDNGKIGQITTAGIVTQYFVNVVEAYDITSGPDGALWFLGWVNGGVTIKVGRITTSGQSTTYTLEPAGDVCFPWPLISGPDGNLWYSDACYTNVVGEMTTAGVISQQYPLPSGQGNGPGGLTVGPDHAVWFPETNVWFGTPTHILGRVAPGGAVTEYNVPFDTSSSWITTGPDGALWVTDGASNIIRVALGLGSGLTITTASLPGGAIGTPYSANLTAQGGTAPYTWTVTSGSLPAGLTLNSFTGAISGTPTGPGSSFTVRVMGSSVPSQSASQALSITISNPGSAFTIASLPSGLSISVDGVSYTAPYTFNCNAGTQHTLAVISPQSTPFLSGGRYSFTGWNDGVASPTRHIMCLSTTTTYTANFNTQYLLSIAVTPSGAGSVVASPASSDGFNNAGASVQLTALGNFVSWSGDLSGSANPQSVIMNGPRSVTANFTTGPPTGAAAFLKTDSLTAGSWRSVYGADGYNVIGDTASYPGYVTVTPTGNALYTWASSTSDPRALQKASSATDRIAACWYSGTFFSTDLKFSDTNSHQVALYLLDWDLFTGGRSERVDILDANGTVLDTRSVSGFANGEYLVWNLNGHVIMRITNTGLSYSNAVASGIFFGGAGSAPPPTGTAAFIKTDTTTAGTWKGVYGADGYNVIGDTVTSPAYVTLTPAGNALYTWASSTSDPRALQKASSATDRIAACWYSGASFTIDLAFKDSNSHQIALYLLDWDFYGGGRTQRMDILDGNGNILDTRAVSNFVNGEYLVWNLSGHVIIRITNTNPAGNAVVSGLFFGGGGTSGGPSTASFIKSDITTSGYWKGVYGADGYNVINDLASYPAYVAVTPGGNSSYTWAFSTSDPRALEKASSLTDRIAACWYSGSFFTIDLAFNDSNTHQVALYLVDWDIFGGGRTQRVDMLDGNGNVLDTRPVSSFVNGQYLVWNLSGHVVVRITNTNPLANAVVSGLFFR